MEAACSSETSVDFQRTTRRYISKHRTIHLKYRWLWKFRKNTLTTFYFNLEDASGMFPEMLVIIDQSTRYHIAEDRSHIIIYPAFMDNL
jgi:hypothetical protein